MSSPKVAGRMALWAIELSEFDIRYQPRAAVKGQILADFIAEFTITKDQEVEETPIWRVHTDGSSNKHAGGVGIVLHTPEEDKIKCMIRLDFATTNNKAEYEALVVGLDLAIAAGAKSVVIYSNSQIMTSQVNGSYDCKNEMMKRYLEKVKGRMNNLQIKVIQIPREENQEVDQLARATSAKPMIIPKETTGNNSTTTHSETFVLSLGSKITTHRPPARPQANGQVEVTNRTTTRTPTRETPFQLAYGSEALIPAEVGLTSYRVESYDKSKNEEALRLQLNLVDEVRAAAAQRLTRYQDMMAKHYNSKVRHRDFQVGDLVLRKVLGTTKYFSQGKLGPNWEGTYKIISWHRKGTYYLETLDGRKLSHPWNTEHLKKYYQ
ncbi:uncharacterized protein LOC142634758 [Castanea sativa]|uniref:uncharacterized protein LOC142634758 n=1 Tax=Castanea sativa TaxID=21020 RepID=UPI003F64DA3C